MSVLSRQTITKLCADEGMVRRLDGLPLKIEPVSIDLHLASFRSGSGTYDRGWMNLRAGYFCLGSVVETFKMPDYVVGFVVGKSTMAREGLQIEAAGLVDPGFEGDITLELKNLHHRDSYRLEIGEPIGQVWFMYVDQSVDIPYGPDNGNHYQGQHGPTPSYRKQKVERSPS